MEFRVWGLVVEGLLCIVCLGGWVLEVLVFGVWG